MMNLNIWTAILIGMILGLIVAILGPLYGFILGFGIISGCLFRALYLLNDIHKRISKNFVKRTRVQAAMDEYLKEKDANQQKGI